MESKYNIKRIRRDTHALERKDSAIFQAQKEYIDTAIIPLTLIDGSSQGFLSAASAAEFTLSLVI